VVLFCVSHPFILQKLAITVSFKIINNNERRVVMEELKSILVKFAESGWDLIAIPSKEYLDGNGAKEDLIKAVEQADKECGSCGCELDPLYKKCIELKGLL
jgi:hypothetical protein